MGNCIQGAFAEAAAAAGGAWTELADVTLGADATPFTTGTFTASRILFFQLMSVGNGVGNTLEMSFNSDTGTNYSSRREVDGDTDQTYVNAANITMGSDNNILCTVLGYIYSEASRIKTQVSWTLKPATSASAAPQRFEIAGNWINTSDDITSIQITAEGTDIKENSRLTVLGTS